VPSTWWLSFPRPRRERLPPTMLIARVRPLFGAIPSRGSVSPSLSLSVVVATPALRLGVEIQFVVEHRGSAGAPGTVEPTRSRSDCDMPPGPIGRWGPVKCHAVSFLCGGAARGGSVLDQRGHLPAARLSSLSAAPHPRDRMLVYTNTCRRSDILHAVRRIPAVDDKLVRRLRVLVATSSSSGPWTGASPGGAAYVPATDSPRGAPRCTKRRHSFRCAAPLPPTKSALAAK
jgi:hypothetical protein